MLTLLIVSLIVPMVYGTYLHDYDHDEGETGSWTWAEVAGWWDPPLVHYAVHDSDYYFAQGYWGISHYYEWPEPGEPDEVDAFTLQRIYVFQDTELVEIVQSLASIPWN